MSKMDSLERQLAHGSTLPFFLQRRIAFREALAEDTAASAAFSYSSNNRKGAGNKMEADANGFLPPSTELFPRSKVKEMMQWEKILPTGPGYYNMGNTCFLNSTLQCLTHTPPLANYLLTGQHRRRCMVEGFCLVCEMEKHLFACFKSQNKQISPNSIVGHLRLIAKHMRVGRQEDSHEFMRFMIDTMQRNMLNGVDVSRLDPSSKETTLLHQIFGGHLQSRVHCLTCNHVSSTFDPLMDLSLDVRNCESINRALQQFVRPERLCKANRYRCENCKKTTDADKSMRFYRLPPILTLHLKRFHMTPFGDAIKVSKYIQFDTELDISPFCATEAAKEGSQYELYAVLVHEGMTCNSGHYYSFVKSSNGVWYCMNDSSVHQVSLKTVLNQRAYILFYSLKFKPSADTISEPTDTVVEQSNRKRSKKVAEIVDTLSAESMPTPPSTPDPAINIASLKELAAAEKSLEVNLADSNELVASSMWHVSKVVNKLKRKAIKPAGWSVADLRH